MGRGLEWTGATQSFCWPWGSKMTKSSSRSQFRSLWETRETTLLNRKNKHKLFHLCSRITAPSIFFLCVLAGAKPRCQETHLVSSRPLGPGTQGLGRRGSAPTHPGDSVDTAPESPPGQSSPGTSPCIDPGPTDGSHVGKCPVSPLGQQETLAPEKCPPAS